MIHQDAASRKTQDKLKRLRLLAALGLTQNPPGGTGDGVQRTSRMPSHAYKFKSKRAPHL